MQQMPVSLQNENAKSAKAYERIAAKLMYPGEGEPAVKKRGMAAFLHILSEIHRNKNRRKLC